MKFNIRGYEVEVKAKNFGSKYNDEDTSEFMLEMFRVFQIAEQWAKEKNMKPVADLSHRDAEAIAKVLLDNGMSYKRF